MQKLITRIRFALPMLLTACVMATGCTYQVKERRGGERALTEGNTTVARIRLERAIQMRPHDPKAALLLGKVEMAEGNAVAAESLFEQAWVLVEEDSEMRQEVLDALAESLYAQKREQDLITRLRSAVHDYGTTRDYIRLGSYLSKLGDPDSAQAAFRQAQVHAASDDPSAEIALARFYETFHDQAEALAAWKRAWAIDPGNKAAGAGLRRMGVVPGPTAVMNANQPAMP